MAEKLTFEKATEFIQPPYTRNAAQLKLSGEYSGDPKSERVRISNGLPGSGFPMVSGFRMVNSLDQFIYKIFISFYRKQSRLIDHSKTGHVSLVSTVLYIKKKSFLYIK